MKYIHKIKTNIHKLRVVYTLFVRLVMSKYLFDYVWTKNNTRLRVLSKKKIKFPGKEKQNSRKHLYSSLLQNSLEEKDLTLIVEDRLIPLVAMGNMRTKPLLYLDLYAENLCITSKQILGKKLPPLKVSLKSIKYLPKYLKLRRLRDATYRGVPVGLWALEGVLRTEKNLGGLNLKSKEIEKLLREKIVFYSTICERVNFVVENWNMSTAIFSHDCYWFGVVNDRLAREGVVVIPMPKGYYGGPIEPDNTKFLSDNLILSRRRAAFLDLIKKIETSNIEGGESIDLPYMKHFDIKSDFYSSLKSIEEFSRFKDQTSLNGVKLYGEVDISCSRFEKLWIFALHSFVDEPCIWGSDGFYTHCNFFLPVAQSINRQFPNDIIAVRPHPNVFASNGVDKPRGAALLDQAAQKKFCKKLHESCSNVFINNAFQSTNEFNGSTTIIVTRWGTIGLEAVEKGTTVVCSRIAPYCEDLSKKLHSFNSESLPHLDQLLLDARNFSADALNDREVEFIAAYNKTLRRQVNGNIRHQSIDATKEYFYYVKAMQIFKKGLKSPGFHEQRLFVSCTLEFGRLFFRMQENELLCRYSAKAMPLMHKRVHRKIK